LLYEESKNKKKKNSLLYYAVDLVVQQINSSLLQYTL